MIMMGDMALTAQVPALMPESTIRRVGKGQHDEYEQADAGDAREKRAHDGGLGHKGALLIWMPLSA